ncbi:hypothetical protein VTL71DRAFT_6871 [Oculimacula yallundae]|uniref:Uncharacterized protein n=1 Tax=Oculimacula yallundae TaxID=86028 RepID=A0ABR4BV39_9HELO
MKRGQSQIARRQLDVNSTGSISQGNRKAIKQFVLGVGSVVFFLGKRNPFTKISTPGKKRVLDQEEQKGSGDHRLMIASNHPAPMMRHLQRNFETLQEKDQPQTKKLRSSSP